MSDSNKYLCIHGHFYQPPRENPWIEEIELQESAAPYHDWNERIYDECYFPNTMARVYDDHGKIVNIVNNFHKISFNIGPTLMSWLQAKQPKIYKQILEADRLSMQENHGHGNALAQAYNHIILPLANRRDKTTQIRWGIYDFQSRFGRLPESMWLPETACDEETLEALIEEGVKFIILEPHQAEKIRPLHSTEDWQEISEGAIDPKQPYRCYSKEHPKKFIDIFFYDGPISKAISFEEILKDSKHLASRLGGAYENKHPRNQLIHVATDGETYGHHKKFSERSLAYLLYHEASRHHFKLTNYGNFLEKNTPVLEVCIKPGENGEGTSWSCSHGVKRWKEHCGCRGDGPAEWRQDWRAPLRASLDRLRDRLAEIFETHGKPYFKDVWAARNDYIQLILDRSPENIERFFAEHASASLPEDSKIEALKLLECQRHAMLMYTSCGWFFTELSGIETVQILEYACRAIHLAQEVSGAQIEGEFLEHLSHAKSNVESFGDGRALYEKFVLSNIVDWERIVCSYAIESIFQHSEPKKKDKSLYTYGLHVFYERKESFGNLTMSIGRLRATSAITLESRDVIFIAIQMGLYDFRCSLMPFQGEEEFKKIEHDFFAWLQTHHIVELLKKIDEIFGEEYMALKDLPSRERRRIITLLTQEMIEKINSVYENLYDENRRMNEVYRAINLPIPGILRHAVQHALTKRLENSILDLATKGYDLKKSSSFTNIVQTAHQFEVELDKKSIETFLSHELERVLQEFLLTHQKDRVMECLHILKLAEKVAVKLDYRRAQNDLFRRCELWRKDPSSIPHEVRECATFLIKLLRAIGLQPEPLKKAMHASSEPSAKRPQHD